MNSIGIIAERKASNYLKKKRYKITDYNFTCRFGEIDLIAEKDGFIIFIEVKARSERSIAEPKEFVDWQKQQRIIASAEYYISTHQTGLQPRFDVIEVYYQNNKIKSIKHLENAFTLD